MSSARTTHREPAAFPPLALGRWCSTWRGGLALVIVCALALLPGIFSLPPIDRDESRFAQASRQMAMGESWVVPRVQDRPRLNKPPLIYWLQASSARGAMLLTGTDPIWAYRLPGVLCAIGTALLTWRLGMSLMDARAAWVGAAGLAVCPLLIVDAHQARADQLLVMLTTASMMLLWHALRTMFHEEQPPGSRARRWRLRALLWACVALGVLAKGPITPMIVLLCVLGMCAMERSWRAWRAARPEFGLAIVVVLVLPWVLLVMREVGAPEYLRIIHEETLGRSLEPKEGHWGPPGYHLVLMVGLLFPLSLVTGGVVAGVLRRGIKRWRWVGDTPTLYLLAWALPALLVFELVSTKLPHYPMPVYPALALLSARGLLSLAGTMPGVGQRVGSLVWALVGLVGLAGATGGLAWVLETPLRGIGILVSVLVAGLLVWAGVYAVRGRVIRAALLGGVASVLALSTSLGMLLPTADGAKTPWVAREASGALMREARDDPMACAGFVEDSMIFLTRGKVNKLDASAAQAWLDANPTGVLLTTREIGAGLSGVRDVGGVTGFNHPRGRMVDLVLLRR